MVWNTMDTGPQELKEDEKDGEAEQEQGDCGGWAGLKVKQKPYY